MSNHSGNQQPNQPRPAAPANQPAPAAPVAAQAAPDPAKPVYPVKRVQFVRSIDLPDKSQSDNVPTSPRAQVLDAEGRRINRGKAYLCDYLPWLRAFRVTYYPPSTTAPTQERVIPEAQVLSWDPV
jgi:hypothetical protein